MSYATEQQIPVVRFAKRDRKAEVIRPYLQAATEPGVVAIGMAQEFQSVFSGYDHNADKPGPPCYAFAKADRRVTRRPDCSRFGEVMRHPRLRSA